MAYSDSFSGADGALSANWTTDRGSLAIASQVVKGTTVDEDNYAHWSANSFANNQYSQVTVAAVNATNGAGPTVRCTGNGTLYFFNGQSGFRAIHGYTGYSWEALAEDYGNGLSNGDVARLEVSVDILTGKINSSTVLGPQTDSSSPIASGSAGIYIKSNASTPTLDNWEGGDLGATAALTGTVTGSITENDIVSGGKTIILTLTGDTYVAAAGTPTYSTGNTAGTTAADSAGGGGGRTGNGDLTCSWPSSYTPTAGHFALMIVYSDQGTMSTPANWSQVTGSPFGSGTEKLAIFYKLLAGGESAPVTTIAGSGTNISHVAQMAIYTGVGSIGAVGTASAGTGTPMTCGGVTTTANGSIVCMCCGRGDNETAGSQTFNASATGVTERLDGGTASGNDSQVSMADKSYPTSGTATGNGSSTTSVTDPWVAVMVELKPSTPFDNQRQAIINGLDSAQSEAAGWDAVVKAGLAVTAVARTSDTVCTITLPAFASYNITAQETITATIPAAALTGNAQIVASPTFTIATGTGSVNVNLTGISATGNQTGPGGSGTARYEVTGVSGTGATTAPSGSVITRGTVTGIQGAGQIQAVTQRGAANTGVTGIQGAGQTTAPSATATARTDATGVQAQGQVAAASATAGAQASVTGTAATGATTAPTAKGTGNTALTGVAASGAVGAVQGGSVVAANAIGIETTSALGALTQTITSLAALTGVALSVGAGTLDVSTGSLTSVSLTGISSTAGIGNLPVTASSTVDLTGISATTGQGAPSESGTTRVSPTGAPASAAIGTVAAGSFSVGQVTGVAATAETGTLTVESAGSISVALSGIAASGTIGSVNGLTGVSVALTGVGGSSHVELLQVSTTTGEAVDLPGIAAIARVGSLTARTGSFVIGLDAALVAPEDKAVVYAESNPIVTPDGEAIVWR